MINLRADAEEITPNKPIINKDTPDGKRVNIEDNDKTGMLENNNNNKNNDDNNDFYKGISVMDIQDKESQGNISNFKEHVKNNPFVINLKSDNISKYK